jgi:hypothetical protein
MGDPFEASIGRWAYVLILLYLLIMALVIVGVIWH